MSFSIWALNNDCGRLAAVARSLQRGHPPHRSLSQDLSCPPSLLLFNKLMTKCRSRLPRLTSLSAPSPSPLFVRSLVSLSRAVGVGVEPSEPAFGHNARTRPSVCPCVLPCPHYARNTIPLGAACSFGGGRDRARKGGGSETVFGLARSFIDPSHALSFVASATPSEARNIPRSI